MFDTTEDEEKFFLELADTILQLFSMNDRIITIAVPRGKRDAVKARLEATPVHMEPVLQGAYSSLVSSIKYEEHDEPDQNVRIGTLKNVMRGHEIMSAHNWASREGKNLYGHLKGNGTVIQPTMQELRLLVLFDSLLDMRGEDSSRVILPSRVPFPTR